MLSGSLEKHEGMKTQVPQNELKRARDGEKKLWDDQNFMSFQTCKTFFFLWNTKVDILNVSSHTVEVNVYVHSLYIFQNSLQIKEIIDDKIIILRVDCSQKTVLEVFKKVDILKVGGVPNIRHLWLKTRHNSQNHLLNLCLHKETIKILCHGCKSVLCECPLKGRGRKKGGRNERHTILHQASDE